MKLLNYKEHNTDSVKLYYLKIIFIALGMSSCGLIDARDNFKNVHNERDFYKRLELYRYSIVLFTKEDSKGSYAMKDQRDDFADVSRTNFYKEGDLQFLNVYVRHNRFRELLDTYAICTFPMMLLFKYGTPLKKSDGLYYSLNGVASPKKIRAYIDRGLKKKLERNIRRKAQIQEEARQRAQEQAAYYSGGVTFNYGFSYPYYYPYGYYNYPYYYGPGFGVGVTIPFR